MKSKILSLFVVIVLLLAVSIFVLADQNYPVGADDVNVTFNSRYQGTNPYEIQAVAGNISHLVVYGVTPTRSWQGYVGNITGNIILADSENNTLYDWYMAEPRGQIYAVNNASVVNWTNIQCFKWDATDGFGTVDDLEGYYNISNGDLDGVNETFNRTSSMGIYVGPTSLPAGTCQSQYMYVNNATPGNTAIFEELLLTDGERIVFTSIIENRDQSGNTTDKTGYDGAIWDFEMIVLEDGHGTNIAAVNYYFYVELE